MREALHTAVGLNHKSAKNSYMQRKVQGHRVTQSVRAVIAPMGLSSEGSVLGVRNLNEVRLPTSYQEKLLKGRDDQSSVWLKRDPVLDRWVRSASRSKRIPIQRRFNSRHGCYAPFKEIGTVTKRPYSLSRRW